MLFQNNNNINNVNFFMEKFKTTNLNLVFYKTQETRNFRAYLEW